MQTIVVTASSAPESSVLPSDQTINSVLGTNLSDQDTPRNVTPVNAELLNAANIQSMADFVKVAPSAYTTDEFGVASVPVIRGQNAEVYINGMQRTTRGDGPPTSFNSVEQANVVTGPASAVYGPTQNTGGYVDLITKQPYFDRFHDDTQFTYGSYDEKMWTEDFGGPIIPDVLAYRVSYQGDYSGSYYNNIKTQSNDGFFALAFKPNSDFHVDFNSEFYDGRFDENIGWDRPTQGLIDGHQYSTGGTTAFGGTSAGGTGVGTPQPPSSPGTYGGVIYSPGTTTLSPQSTLVAPGDSSYGKDVNAELSESYTANDNLSFVNRTYFEYLELRETQLAEAFTNLQDSNIVQDRFEVHFDFDTPIGNAPSSRRAEDPKDLTSAASAKSTSIQAPFIDPKSEIITGVALKYINGLGYQDYFSADFLNATDLSTGVYPNVPLQRQAAGSTVFPVPGANFYAYPGTYGQPNTNREEAYAVSPFFQHQITFTPQWMLLYSGRADVLYDDLNDPLGSYVGNTAQAQTSQVLATADASIDYKPQPWVTLYSTFDFNESYAGNEEGGFDTYSNGGQSVDYHYKNFLYEGGAKLDLLDHTVFATADGYFQTHNTTNALGFNEQIRTIGAEVSTTYQPDKHFYLALNESYLDSIVVDPAAEYTRDVYDAFSTNSVGVSGTGVGAPNFLPYPAGHYREAGLPQFLLSGLASYKLDNGFGASMNYVITDPIPTSEAENVWIPWQYEIDASLFYQHKGFSARVTLYNITDQHNFSTGGTLTGSGNDLITIHEPFHWEATLGYQF